MFELWAIPFIKFSRQIIDINFDQSILPNKIIVI